MDTDTACGNNRSWPPAIALGLVLAQKAANPVEKDARNDFHKYAYASAEAVITEGRLALAAGGLALIQAGHEPVAPFMVPADPWAETASKAWEGATKEPWPSTPYRLRIQYLLVHESGAVFAFERSDPVWLEKGRPPDKAEAGTLTTSLSYALRGLLLLAREDGTDMNQRDDRGHEPGKLARPPAGPQGGAKAQAGKGKPQGGQRGTQERGGRDEAPPPEQEDPRAFGEAAADPTDAVSAQEAQTIKLIEALEADVEKAAVAGDGARILHLLKTARGLHEKGTPVSDAAVRLWATHKHLVPAELLKGAAK